MRPPPGGGAASPGLGGRFPKAVRMRRDREFRDVVLKGERTKTPHFALYRDHGGAGGKPSRSGPQRAGLIGISVGRKAAATATARNRLKRLLREFCRLHKGLFPPGTRTAVVARRAPEAADLAAVTAELLPAILGRWGRKEGASPCGQGISS